ncbi:glycosyltransferase family 2 protein [Alicyclobacillus sp. SO9]|uniref:glycosyltransferase family 2 protein n=1 Tax=Alicyclobacillus sp. SO9 TaxID=2665646 RepID=UPI0018E7A751|nr:glycosyltransferase family 2 protein [Alicyclobacillus sp. SO9]QQE78111.1 glycosyltransferase family 2 protein [Alicyclobacillus sp. SO9]
MLLSACLIVRNEELTLSKCLDSLTDVVDEIVLVDTGSTDSTVSIAESYGARVFHYDWDDNFANARNYSLDQAQGDFVLVIDGDEYLDASQRTGLRSFLQTTDAEGIIVSLQNYNGSPPRIVPAVPVSLVRVFRRGHHFQGAIHEQILDSILETGKSLVKYNLTIHHVGYLTEIVHSRNKISRNMKILDEEEVSSEKQIFHDTNKMMEFIRADDFEKCLSLARETYTRLKRQKPESWSHIEARAFIIYIIALKETGNKKEALEISREAFHSFPNYIEIAYRFGESLLGVGKLDEAVKQFNYCRDLGEPNENWLDTQTGFGSYKAAARLAEAWGKLGDDVLARTWYLTAAYENPAVQDSLLPLLYLLQQEDNAAYAGKLESLFSDPMSILLYAEASSILGLPQAPRLLSLVDEDLRHSAYYQRALMVQKMTESGEEAFTSEHYDSGYANYLVGLHLLNRGDETAAQSAFVKSGPAGEQLFRVWTEASQNQLMQCDLQPYIFDLIAMRAENVLARLLPHARDLDEIWLYVKYSPLSPVLTSIDWDGLTGLQCEQNSTRLFRQKNWESAADWLEKAMVHEPTVSKVLIECDIALAHSNKLHVFSVLRQGLLFFPDSEVLKIITQNLGINPESLTKAELYLAGDGEMNPFDAYRKSVLTMPLNVQLAQLHERAGVLTQFIKEQAESQNVNAMRKYIEELQNIITFLRTSLDTEIEAASMTDQVYSYYYRLSVNWFLEPNKVLEDYDDAVAFWESWAQTWKKVPSGIRG